MSAVYLVVRPDYCASKREVVEDALDLAKRLGACVALEIDVSRWPDDWGLRSWDGGGDITLYVRPSSNVGDLLSFL